MQTAETIMEEMEKRVRENQSISPSSWIEAAQRTLMLSGDFDNKLANYEAEMLLIEAEYLKQDMSSAKAKTLSKSQIDYKDYLTTKALVARIKEWGMLAKKRAMINEI
jgi:hypothetical protein